MFKHRVVFFLDFFRYPNHLSSGSHMLPKYLLPQLKWRTLNDADINRIPFEAEKKGFKCDYRGFEGLGVAMLPSFWSASIKHILFHKQKHCALSALSGRNLCYFSIF